MHYIYYIYTGIYTTYVYSEILECIITHTRTHTMGPPLYSLSLRLVLLRVFLSDIVPMSGVRTYNTHTHLPTVLFSYDE